MCYVLNQEHCPWQGSNQRGKGGKVDRFRLPPCSLISTRPISASRHIWTLKRAFLMTASKSSIRGGFYTSKAPMIARRLVPVLEEHSQWWLMKDSTTLPARFEYLWRHVTKFAKRGRTICGWFRDSDPSSFTSFISPQLANIHITETSTSCRVSSDARFLLRFPSTHMPLKGKNILPKTSPRES